MTTNPKTDVDEELALQDFYRATSRGVRWRLREKHGPWCSVVSSVLCFVWLVVGLASILVDVPLLDALRQGFSGALLIQVPGNMWVRLRAQVWRHRIALVGKYLIAHHDWTEDEACELLHRITKEIKNELRS